MVALKPGLRPEELVLGYQEDEILGPVDLGPEILGGGQQQRYSSLQQKHHSTVLRWPSSVLMCLSSSVCLTCVEGWGLLLGRCGAERTSASVLLALGARRIAYRLVPEKVLLPRG